MLTCLIVVSVLLLACCVAAQPEGDEPICVSGIYPHLGVFNRSMECGIGAVVPWAGRLWFLTYSPHAPEGSADRLYELLPDLQRAVRPESIGGTPANRMVHRESDQLIIGPYFIDRAGNVRAVPYSEMPGRPTATMRHLTDPASKVYVFDMEGALYEVDVHTLGVTRLFGQHTAPGSHGKGACTAQGRVVLANNGEWDWYQEWAKDRAYEGPTGALVEWDGSELRLLERRQFCEVTGPEGIAPTSSEGRLWATGWDKRSVILKLLDGGEWQTFRLPKASHTHDAGHGWYTEWPRIREIGDGTMLMTMHGMFWDLPPTFSARDSSGLRPLSTYLKMVVDFCDWDGRLVFACNDTSLFDNPLAGQAQSNLWFGTRDDLRRFGPPAGWGGPWVNDSVKAGAPSDPFLIGGFGKRVLHLSHREDKPVTFALELDERGAGEWTAYRQMTVPANGYEYRLLPEDLQAEWMRLRGDRDCEGVTAYLHLAAVEDREEDGVFASLPSAAAGVARTTGVIRPRGEDLGTLHFLAQRVSANGSTQELGYYETGQEMKLRKVDDPKVAEWLRSQAGLGEPDFAVDAASVILTEADGRRWRLPKGDPAYDKAWPEGWPRGLREVVTERSLLNCHGTIYEVPRESSGGTAGIRPVCTHSRMIADFCSWRGMLVLSGNLAAAKPDGHYFASDDGQAGLWFGNVDDLWRLGKPQGRGGPWHETHVEAGVPSDPYLMTGYDRKRLELAHEGATEVTFTVEVDFVGDGTWHVYERFTVPPGQKRVHEFPDGYSAHWVRLTADRDCAATAQFVYE